MRQVVRLIDVSCARFGPVSFIGEVLNDGTDFLIDDRCRRESLETLIFLDSRGVGGRFGGSLIERILGVTKVADRCLAICRPLELTTWATLYNFLSVNKLRPAKIITNMGFVDFTPKKDTILRDAIMQIEALMGVSIADAQHVENYAGRDGESMPLSSMSYGVRYRECIENALKGSRTVVINTPIVGPQACGSRSRPKAFFEGIEAANSFNRSLEGVSIIELPEFDQTMTYDGVHYTNRGNAMIFEALKPHLDGFLESL